MLIVFFVLFFFFIEQSNTIVNTAILTNQPVSLPVVVLAVSHDGTVSDVTSAVTCQSTNESTVKVCGLVFFLYHSVSAAAWVFFFHQKKPTPGWRHGHPPVPFVRSQTAK